MVVARSCRELHREVSDDVQLVCVAKRVLTSAVVELGSDADTSPILGREGKVRLAHGRTS